MIFRKGAKAKEWRKDSLFNKWGFKKCFRHKSYTFHKYFQKMDNKPKYKTTEHLEDNTGDNEDLRYGKEF